MPNSIVPSRGFIGFFDILGYGQLLKRNEIPRVIEILHQNIGELPNFGNEMFGRPIAEFKDQAIADVISSLQWLSFADSILLALPVTPTEDLGPLAPPAVDAIKRQRRVEAAVFFSTVSLFMLKMFRNGLPLRGAVDYGHYYIKSPFFAGASISEAYELASQQEWCGCALTKSAVVEAESILKGDDPVFFDHSLPRYGVPCKGGVSLDTRAVNWAFWSPWNFGYVEGVLREAVLESFLDHNKVLKERELPKVGNTEVFLNLTRSSAKAIKPPPWLPLILAHKG